MSVHVHMNGFVSLSSSAGWFPQCILSPQRFSLRRCAGFLMHQQGRRCPQRHQHMDRQGWNQTWDQRLTTIYTTVCFNFPCIYLFSNPFWNPGVVGAYPSN